MYRVEHIDHEFHVGLLIYALQILFECVYNLHQQYLLDIIYCKNLFI